ncbi:MAG: hypothetical protein IT373_38510 [Polyangiaceae bacterium]|nr:hypothetical protein [Polyangiaceae bacterium]
MKRWHPILAAAAALSLAATSAALGTRTKAKSSASDAAEVAAPESLGPFELAKLLAEAPPDVVVVALDEASPPLRGSVPAALFGASDEDLVARAPKARSVVLAARDVVRADRLARAILGQHGRARVLEGGLDAWDEAMKADPPAPGAGALEADWLRYRRDVALRHAFGEAASAPAAPVAAPVAPVAPGAAPGAGTPKKREGC